MQLLITCRIRHCWYRCPVLWAVTQSSRAAKRDVIGYNFASWIAVDMSSIMLTRLRELCKNCASRVRRPVLLFYSKWSIDCGVSLSLVVTLLQSCRQFGGTNEETCTSSFHVHGFTLLTKPFPLPGQLAGMHYHLTLNRFHLAPVCARSSRHTFSVSPSWTFVVFSMLLSVFLFF